MHHVQFNDLPQATRRRVAADTRGKGATPILMSPQSLAEADFSTAMLVVLALGWVLILLVNNLGSLGPSAFLDWWDLASLGGSSWLLLGAALGFVSRRDKLRRLPWKPGRYVFEDCFVDARKDRLGVAPLADLLDVRLVQPTPSAGAILTLDFDDQKESFSFADAREAKTKADALYRARQSKRGTANRDVALKPWMREPNPADTDAGPYAARSPWLLRHYVVTSLLLAVVGAPVVHHLRNQLSDDAMFATAMVGKASVLRKYIKHGRGHVQEARTALPRVALKDALEARDSRTRLLKFLGSEYALTDRTLHREACQALASRAEERVGQTDSIPELRQFARQAGECEAEGVRLARAKIGKQYDLALSRFAKQAPAENPDVLAFIQALLTRLEDFDESVVEIVFHPPETRDLEEAHELVLSMSNVDAAWVDSLVPIARHFVGPKSRLREGEVVARVKEQFRKVFDEELLSLQLVETTQPAPPAAERPRMTIKYRVAPDVQDGRVIYYTLEGSERQYYGIVVSFDVRCTVPGGAKAYEFRFSIRPPKRFTTQTTQDRHGRVTAAQEERDADVYDVMTKRAFDQLGARLTRAFFSSRAGATVTELLDEAAELAGSGSFSEAERLAGQARKDAESKYGSRSSEVLYASLALARIQRERGAHGDALATIARAHELVTQPPSTAAELAVSLELAEMLVVSGQKPKAVALLNGLVGSTVSALAPEGEAVWAAARVRWELQVGEETRDARVAALATAADRATTARQPVEATAETLLVVFALELVVEGQKRDAQALVKKAVAQLEAAGRVQAEDYVLALISLVRIEAESKNYGAAAREARKALGVMGDGELWRWSAERGELLVILAVDSARRGRRVKARRYLGEAVEVLERALGPDDPYLTSIRTQLRSLL